MGLRSEEESALHTAVFDFCASPPGAASVQFLLASIILFHHVVAIGSSTEKKLISALAIVVVPSLFIDVSSLCPALCLVVVRDCDRSSLAAALLEGPGPSSAATLASWRQYQVRLPTPIVLQRAHKPLADRLASSIAA